MKSIYKVLICFSVGICFIFAGVSLGGMNEVYPLHFIGNIHFKWNSDAINDIHFQADSNTDEIDIQVHNGNVEFQVKENINHIEVHASQVYNGFDIYQKGDKIKIEQPHYWHWSGNRETAKIRIDVPSNFELDKVNIDMSAGRTTINQLKTKQLDIDATAGKLEINDSICNKLNLDASMGEIVMNNLTCPGKMDIDLGMGNVDIDLNGRQEEYNYSVGVSLGNVNIGRESFSGIANRKSQQALGDKFIDVNCGLGNVNIGMEEY